MLSWLGEKWKKKRSLFADERMYIVNEHKNTHAHSYTILIQYTRMFKLFNKNKEEKKQKITKVKKTQRI